MEYGSCIKKYLNNSIMNNNNNVYHYNIESLNVGLKCLILYSCENSPERALIPNHLTPHPPPPPPTVLKIFIHLSLSQFSGIIFYSVPSKMIKSNL